MNYVNLNSLDRKVTDHQNKNGDGLFLLTKRGTKTMNDQDFKYLQYQFDKRGFKVTDHYCVEHYDNHLLLMWKTNPMDEADLCRLLKHMRDHNLDYSLE